MTYRADAVVPGALHVCVPGHTADGHDFAAEAVRRGAAALVVERDLAARRARSSWSSRRGGRWPPPPTPSTATRRPSSTWSASPGRTARRRRPSCSTPSSRRPAVGPGLLGTVEQRVGGRVEPVVRTTPESVDLQAVLRRMADAGDTACVMEVSSHALELDRVAGVRFAAAAFTNLTQDHLDFHPDMEHYYRAKARLFETRAGRDQRRRRVRPPAGRRGRRAGAHLRPRRPGRRRSPARGRDRRGRRHLADRDDARAARCRSTCACAAGSTSRTCSARSRVAEVLEVPHDAVRAGIAAVAGVPGRFEPVDAGQPFTVLVDYAHTPDGLENVLRSAREITAGRLICVFGCGGDRDRGKRPLMGAVVRRLADVAVVTSDNPRSEDPAAIIADITAGFAMDVEVDRRTAIERAVGMAGAGRRRRHRRQGARAGPGAGRPDRPVRRPRGGARGARGARRRGVIPLSTREIAAVTGGTASGAGVARDRRGDRLAGRRAGRPLRRPPRRADARRAVRRGGARGRRGRRPARA